MKQEAEEKQSVIQMRQKLVQDMLFPFFWHGFRSLARFVHAAGLAENENMNCFCHVIFVIILYQINGKQGTMGFIQCFTGLFYIFAMGSTVEFARIQDEEGLIDINCG
jgi:hypothetical protein